MGAIETSATGFPLGMHLYETYADNCIKLGKPQEGIQTLQALVHQNPEHLSGWLRLALFLLETGQVQQALSTMKELTALHPRYQEGHSILQRLLAKCGNSQDNTIPTQQSQAALPQELNETLQDSAK